ncbi:hypothetical protein FKW77_002164 [Venturia effusa]|uniref:BRCT domain-containing protein n=1 Tax=Venturia effusa TaxID=50376 RepID=A0A517LQU9_9PEZI|nr:hypothetical protein FKW77_002164 [Venturia effusa]
MSRLTKQVGHTKTLSSDPPKRRVMASAPSHVSSNGSRDAPTATAPPSTIHRRIEFTQSGIAQPSKNVFDPWNTASTGHQRAENRLSGSTSWRDSRNQKLSAQYHGGSTGGKRVADSVGAGSEAFGKDGRKANGGWKRGASGLRGKGQRSIMEAFAGSACKQASPPPAATDESSCNERQLSPQLSVVDTQDLHYDSESIPPSHQPADNLNETRPHQDTAKKQIFDSLCVYINGTTGPLVSDHRLKYLLAQHGARMSIALGRRSVTHVILGNTYNKGGAGGGLAGTKIQKEVARVGGKGIKFVSVEWYGFWKASELAKDCPKHDSKTLDLEAMGKVAYTARSRLGNQTQVPILETKGEAGRNSSLSTLYTVIVEELRKIDCLAVMISGTSYKRKSSPARNNPRTRWQYS